MLDRRSALLLLLDSSIVLGLAGCGLAAQGAPETGSPTAAATPTSPGSLAQPTATAMQAATATPVARPTGTAAPAAPTATATTVAMPTAPPATATPAATTTAPATGTAAAAGELNVEVVATGLEIPWEIAFAPDGRVFVTERHGRVRVFKNGQLLPDPWMTFNVVQSGEGGLLGLALDPQFSQNHFVYVAYTYNSGNGVQNRLVRLRDDPAGDKGATDKVLLDGVEGGSNHDGGRVKFGPDGKLYWGVGETFQRQLAQDMGSLNGKILRLNADGSIPADNPFTGSPIYAYGLRNPQGLAWQPGTGRLYATDQGPSGEKGVGQDEVNYIQPGHNYGWPVISGAETAAGMESPVVQSGSSTTWAPSGCTFVSKGLWAGSLLFAGLRGNALYRLVLDASDPHKATSLQPNLNGQYGRLRTVVEGPDALYVLTSNRDGRGSPGPDDDRILRLTFR